VARDRLRASPLASPQEHGEVAALAVVATNVWGLRMKDEAQKHFKGLFDRMASGDARLDEMLSIDCKGVFYNLAADHSVQPASSFMRWMQGRFDRFLAIYNESGVDADPWRVALDHVDDVEISTVFIGVDFSMQHRQDGQPRVFETMVFGGPLDGKQMVCSTWDEAEKQHRAIVELVRAKQPHLAISLRVARPR
jgi:hypothetical protein